MLKLEELEHPPFVIVQSKMLVPTPNAVMVVIASVGLETTPEPEIIDHTPTPKVGTFAAKVASGELTQIL
jgi:hypothetical protein